MHTRFYNSPNLRDLKEGVILLLSSLLLLAAHPADAQTSASERTTISVSILPAVSITSSAGSDGAGDLNFGLTIVNTTASINPNTSSLASLFTIGVLIAFSFVPDLMAQSSSAQTRSVSIGFAVGLSVYADKGLNFGNAVAGTSIDSVTITDAAAGKVTISGQFNKTVSVTLTPPVSLINGSNSIPYTPGAGHNNTADAPASATIWTTPSGTQTGIRLRANRSGQTAGAFVYIFGSVNVGTVPPGIYTGTYLVSVSY